MKMQLKLRRFMASRSMLIFVACILSIFCLVKSSEPSSEEQQLEAQILQTYRTACSRVQNLADWMATVLKMKGLWTKSMSRKAGDGQVMELISRVKRDTKSTFSCASLKNLHQHARKYLQSQSELLQATAIAGSNLLKSGRAMLEDTAQSLRLLNDGIKDLFISNLSSSDLLNDLKDASKTLSHQLQSERARALGFLHDVRNGFGFLRFWYENTNVHNSNETDEDPSTSTQPNQFSDESSLLIQQTDNESHTTPMEFED